MRECEMSLAIVEAASGKIFPLCPEATKSTSRGGGGVVFWLPEPGKSVGEGTGAQLDRNSNF